MKRMHPKIWERQRWRGSCKTRCSDDFATHDFASSGEVLEQTQARQNHRRQNHVEFCKTLWKRDLCLSQIFGNLSAGSVAKHFKEVFE